MHPSECKLANKQKNMTDEQNIKENVYQIYKPLCRISKYSYDEKKKKIKRIIKNERNKEKKQAK